MTGMGHTRWATHGGPTDRNAHPHTDISGRVAVIHNGIIENFARAARTSSRPPASRCAATPTPRWSRTCSAPAFADGPTAGDLPASMAAVCRGLDGAFTLVAMHADAPEMLVAARRNSPLVVGVGDGEMFVASDVAAFIAHTRDAVELGQDQLVVITPDGYEVTSFTGGEPTSREFHVDWDLSAAEKGGFDFFMDKEIAEQPQAVADTLLGHFDGSGIVLDEQRLSDDDLRTIDKVFVVACGTAYHSGLIAKYAIEHWCRIPVEVEVASEFRYRDPVLDRDTLVVAVSQSGETADTLEAVRHARRQRARVLAVCNTNGSQIPRESDAVLYTHAGPEVGVASTKAFLAQLTANYLVGLALAQARGTKYRDEIAPRVRAALRRCRRRSPKTLTLMDPVRKLAQEIAQSKAVLFLGRHVGYPVALEGALKLKELAYMHAEGFAAGELKHGPIALIEEGLPVVVDHPVAGHRPAAALQAAVQHPGDPGPRRAHHRHRRGGRRDRRAVRRLPGRAAAGAEAVPAAGRPPCRCRSWPPRSPGPRLRHRQAAQPGQVRHGRVDAGADRRCRRDARGSGRKGCRGRHRRGRGGAVRRRRWPARPALAGRLFDRARSRSPPPGTRAGRRRWPPGSRSRRRSPRRSACRPGWTGTTARWSPRTPAGRELRVSDTRRRRGGRPGHHRLADLGLARRRDRRGGRASALGAGRDPGLLRRADPGRRGRRHRPRRRRAR